jgi:hypothetical protein
MMFGVWAFALLLQGAPQTTARADIPVQLGVNVTSDTVTVGQRFIAIIRVRAPKGATIEFPVASDSASAASATATELIGKPAIQTVPDSTGTTMSAAYRLAAWDIGLQRFGLPDVVVKLNGQTGFVSLSDRGVFVKSVLPEDSTLRVPKPPRPAIVVPPFNWLPVLMLLAALLLALIAWRVWVWYRRRQLAPVDPFTAAEREFARIEAMQLIKSGESERHAALMSDVMRDYLAARVPEIERSHTSSELLAAGSRVHSVAKGLGELLWRTDLVKFAGVRLEPDEAERLGASARGIVKTVEDHMVEEEERAEARKAA